jgi:hypothetical protein
MDASGVASVFLILALGSVACFFSIRTTYRMYRSDLRKPLSDRHFVGD